MTDHINPLKLKRPGPLNQNSRGVPLKKLQKAHSVSDHLLHQNCGGQTVQNGQNGQPSQGGQNGQTSTGPSVVKPTRPKLARGKSESNKPETLDEIHQFLASGLSIPPKRCSNCGRLKTNVSENANSGNSNSNSAKTGSTKDATCNANVPNAGTACSQPQLCNVTPVVVPTTAIVGNGTEEPNGHVDLKKVITLWQNYYPEGHWGWIIVTSAFFVQCIAHGSQLSYSVLAMGINAKFGHPDPFLLGILGPLSLSTSLLLSPIWVALCKRKSTRLVGIFGGLVVALAYLFTSFASQFHQLFISYGLLLGVGVGCSRDAASLMVGGYFKKKREFVEIIVVAASGVGIIFMSAATQGGITQLGWRIGLQAITGCVLLLFFLGIFYRSPSLYHPQRRAILHLKNQRRKIKEKYKKEDKLPFFDWSCLKSMTLKILFGATGLLSFGIYVPLLFMYIKCQELRLESTCTTFHFCIGGSWIIGCLVFGFITVQQKDGCTISKQYLYQGSGTISALSIFMLIFARDYNSLAMFSCVNGFALGAFNYTLKVYTLDRARARHFPRAWSYLQFVQSVTILAGAMVSSYLIAEERLTVALATVIVSTLAGVFTLFLANVRRRSLASQGKPTESFKVNRKDLLNSRTTTLAYVLGRDDVENDGGRCNKDGSEMHASFDSSMLSKNLVSISEEGLAEIDFQELYFEDMEEIFGADAITSCNKVENCIASEAEAEQFMENGYWDPQKSSQRGGHQRRNSTAVIDQYRNPNNYVQYKPQRQFHTIASIGKPTVEVLSGVVAMNTFGSHHTSFVNANCKRKSALKNMRENHTVIQPGLKPSLKPGPTQRAQSSYDNEISRLSSIPSYASLQKKSKHSQPKY